MNRVMALVLGVFFIGFCQTAQAETCWVFEQTSKLKGKQKVIVSPTGIRHENSDIVMVSQAPAWSMTVFNTKAKTVFQTNSSKVLSNAGINNEILIGEYFSTLKVFPQKDNKELLGVPVRHFTMNTGRVASKNQAKEVENLRRWVSRIEVLSVDMWAFNQFMPSRAMQARIDDLYKLPRVPGIPMTMIYHDSLGNTVNELTTQKVSKATTTREMFSAPKSYKKVDAIGKVAVIRSQAQMDGMAKLFQQWRDTTDPTKK